MKRSQKKWSQAEIDLLAKIYPARSNAYISEMLHRSPRGVMSKAHHLNLHKNAEFAAAQKQKGMFRKGHVPHNKGKEWKYYMSEEEQNRARKTQYKKGVCRDDNPRKRSAGYECLRSVKGRQYWWIKPDDGRKMMPKHRYVWEKANGPIPEGHCVQFKDGDTLNCRLENLCLISRGKLLRKNFDELPEERKAETRAKQQATIKKSIRADRLRIKWGLEPRGKLIKRRPL